MFKYGKKAGILSIVLAALAIIPVLVVMYFIPQLPESVPMEFSAGVATRFSNRYELLLVPAFAFLLCMATYMSAGKQARAHEEESEAAAVLTAERYLRNGVVTGVVLNLANAYLVYMAVTGSAPGM